jgi:aspartate/methionine/tyrosine aminotransferase
VLECGVVVSPGSYFGPSGEGYFRISLVPTVEDCRRAVELLERVL